MARDLCIQEGDQLVLSLHPGQTRAWNSQRRFVGVLAGTQGGKTSFGPHWMLREVQRLGPGDYGVVTPTFQLLEKKALPEFKKLFQSWMQLGRYQGSPSRKFTFSADGDRRLFGHHNPSVPTVVWFGYAEDPESLESATWRAVWCDEAGQRKFKLASWEAILRRLSLALGRALVTTTPYDLGWLKQQFYDKWKAGDPDYAVIRFDSTENPNFPQEEFERARRDLPRWKFNLFYRAIFTRPAGLIYDAFLDDYVPRGHKRKRFDIPADWPRFLGLDFGGVNTAGIFLAQEMAYDATTRLTRPVDPAHYILYREYKAGGRTAAEHAVALRQGEARIPVCVGGSKSEGQWRNEFRAGGLTVLPPPLSDVEVGIDRVYGAHKRAQFSVFDDLAGYLEQKATYSRVVDEHGEPTEAIEDKAAFHFMDAERYISAHLFGSGGTVKVLKQGRFKG